MLVETKWFYEMINLMTVITGNVQSTSAENEGRSELALFLKIQKSHCRTGSTWFSKFLAEISIKLSSNAILRLSGVL